MSEQVRIIYTEGDFFQCQNYVLELLTDKKISQSAFILYCFYKSTGGFSQINYSYDYIVKNSGISKGSITKGIKELENAGLVEVTRYGTNKTFDIYIVPGSNLPRRQLRTLEKTGKIMSKAGDVNENFKAQEELKQSGRKKKNPLPIESMRHNTRKKYNKNIDFDPTSLSSDAIEFWNTFQEEWKRHAKSNYYPKDDMYQLTEINDYEEATKLIPVMWALDEVDKWTKNSDHTMSVFAHLYNIGKLQAHYPKTSFYYRNQQNNEK